MKKTLLVFAVFGAMCTLGFSEKAWLFESGSRDLNGKVFGRISVINKTGEEIDVSGEALEDNGKGLYFEDSIVISCREKNGDYCDAFYSIDGKHLQIVVCPHGTYELDSNTCILPPMRLVHDNPPPPPRHHRRYDHGHAPRRMERHHPPRHHEPNVRRRDYMSNQNNARPLPPDSPQNDSRPPRPENPRRPMREQNR